MSDKSGIEWTDATWNPVTGCNKVSAGCRNCYAERMAERLQKMGAERYRNGFDLTLHEDVLEQPLKWKRGRRIFVNSMSDLFHENVPDDFIVKVFDVMKRCPQHTFQILTKRSERLAELGPWLNWCPNIWMGVSVENQDVHFRIDDLRHCGAAVKFLSVEPLIGPLWPRLDGIDWVIVGGESGPGARPLRWEWVSAIYGLCMICNVPFFLKQWGQLANNPDQNDPTAQRGDPNYAKGGCQIGGRIYRAIP